MCRRPRARLGERGARSPVDAYAVLGPPGPDTTLRLWDLESGERRPLQGHDGPVIGALLLPDGRRALSGSEDRTLRLRDLAERQEIKRFIGDDFITTVTLAVQRQLLLAGDAGGRIMFFELPRLIQLDNRRHR